MYIMNFKWQILHYDPNQNIIYHTEIDKIEKDKVISIDNYYDIRDREDDYILCENKKTEFESELPILGKAVFSYKIKESCYQIANEEGKILGWDHSGYSFSRDQWNLFEMFLLIDDELIEKILYIKSNRWVSQRNKKLYNSEDINCVEGFLILIDEFVIDVRLLTRQDVDTYRFIGTCQSWKPEIFFLFRPLIYVTAYSNEDVLEQLKLCIYSLRDIAHYNDPIVVMTDKESDYIAQLCNGTDTSNLKVDPIYPKDFVGYVCSKYNIYNKSIYEGYQPLLYIDPDLIFDNSIEQMLIDITLSQSVCAPLEEFSLVSEGVSVGSGLVKLDDVKHDPLMAGFNGGTIGIPNVHNTECRKNFEIVKRVITNVGLQFGRKHNQWADQESVNYVNIKFNYVDTTVCTKYVNYQKNDPYIKQNLKGFVHFFGFATHEKPIIMRGYLTSLYDIYNIIPPSNIDKE